MSDRLPTLTLFAGLLIVLLGSPGVAQVVPQQQPPAETEFGSEITVTATGFESEVADVPVAVTVITRKQMDDTQDASVSEMLRRVPGMTVVQSGETGALTSVFTRGTNSSRTLILFDGVRLNSPYYGGFDWSLPTTTALERIEVARGPYSALWGADAVGGVINLIPYREYNKVGGRLLAEGGEDGWQRWEVSAGYASAKFDVHVSGYRRSGDGTLENNDFTNQQGLTTAGYNWGQGSRIGFVYQDLSSKIGIPFVTPDQPTPNRTQETTQRLLAIPLKWKLAAKWNLEVVASRVQRGFDFSDTDDPWELFFDTTEANTDEARVASHHQLGGHAISFGGGWREDIVTDTNSCGTTLDNVSDQTWSAFAQDNWQVWKKFRLLLGVRWDDTDAWGSKTTGRIDFGWRLADTFELRGGYGQAYRAPSLGELYAPIGGNPALEPETSNSGELGVVYTPLSGHSRWQLNLFTTDIDELIEFDYATYQNVNSGTARIKGAEFVWEQGALDVIRWYLQASYLDTEGEDGLSLLRRPRFSASWTLNGSIGHKWSGDVTVLWVDSRADVNPETFERTENQSYTTINFAVAWEAWQRLSITARALNVLDADYQEVLGYPAPGRRFLAGLRYGF
ncbi:MAG: TonB-dependent receptor [Candidatus Aminicenantes bacterium]|nr:MAG: TonB-dependent receptor [Candidatus Aminicenantes bacterium]